LDKKILRGEMCVTQQGDILITDSNPPTGRGAGKRNQQEKIANVIGCAKEPSYIERTEAVRKSGEKDANPSKVTHHKKLPRFTTWRRRENVKQKRIRTFAIETTKRKGWIGSEDQRAKPREEYMWKRTMSLQQKTGHWGGSAPKTTQGREFEKKHDKVGSGSRHCPKTCVKKVRK